MGLTYRPERPERPDDFWKVIDPELISWGESIMSFYGAPVQNSRPIFDDMILPKVPKPPIGQSNRKQGEKKWIDPNGNLMGCIICNSAWTLDGRFCIKHTETS